MKWNINSGGNSDLTDSSLNIFSGTILLKMLIWFKIYNFIILWIIGNT